MTKPVLRKLVPVGCMAALLIALVSGCGKKPEQNRFTTPEHEVTVPIGISNELEEAHAAYAEAKEAMENEDWNTAASLLQTLLEGPAPEAVFANDLGFVEMQRGNLDLALEALDQAVYLDPEYERAYFNLGMALSRLGERDEAIKAYREAIDLNDYYYEAWYNLGLLYYKKGKLDAAERAFLNVTERTRASRFNKAYYQLGLIAAKRGDDAAAAAFYSESLLLDPSHVPSYINKATALLRSGQLSQAEDLLLNSIALEPENYRAHYNLAIVLRRLERFNESREAYQRAIDLKPESRNAWLNLGYVHAYLGDKASAEQAFQHALEIDPEYESAKAALAQLKAGEIRP